MLVYREATEQFTRCELQAALYAAFSRLEASPHDPDVAVSALIRAGELESALADLDAEGCDSESAAQVVALTDVAAAAVVGAMHDFSGISALDSIGRLDLPAQLSLRPLEGFAYYALHPLQYASMAEDFLKSQPPCRRAAVVGIRSIGAPLSAVVAQALRQRGIRVDRITVRPTGHPFNRDLRLTHDQASWVECERAAGAEFLVIDEGPGRSGSSFLAVGEALVRQGIQTQRITFFCSYKPEVNALSAADAPSRWAKFQCLWPGDNTRQIPADADRDISAGRWREVLFRDPAAWPGSWTATERVKFLSDDGKSFLKFEGLGRYGESVVHRSLLAAEEGFSPPCEAGQFGFARYSRIHGRPATAEGHSAVLHRLAHYCAFRRRAFAVASADSAELERMAGFNLEQILGAPVQVRLPIVHPVICDGRLMPHEWIQTPAGPLLKTDCASHGDDHFYPGPTDIAWDLAGAIVEWQMPPAAAKEFLSCYAAQSGDDARGRIGCYIAAYLAFRIGFLQMAAQSSDQAERTRLLRDCEVYRSKLARLISQPLAQTA